MQKQHWLHDAGETGGNSWLKTAGFDQARPGEKSGKEGKVKARCDWLFTMYSNQEGLAEIQAPPNHAHSRAKQRFQIYTPLMPLILTSLYLSSI